MLTPHFPATASISGPYEALLRCRTAIHFRQLLLRCWSNLTKSCRYWSPRLGFEIDDSACGLYGLIYTSIDAHRFSSFTLHSPGEYLLTITKFTHRSDPSSWPGLKPWKTINQAFSSIHSNCANHNIASVHKVDASLYDGNTQRFYY